MEGGRQIGAAGVLHRRADGQPWPCRLAWLLRSIGAVSGQRHRTAAFADSLAAAQQALVVADCCSAKNGAVSRPTAPTMLLVLTSGSVVETAGTRSEQHSPRARE